MHWGLGEPEPVLLWLSWALVSGPGVVERWREHWCTLGMGVREHGVCRLRLHDEGFLLETESALHFAM